MSLHVMTDLVQDSEEWYDQRRGMVTASAVGQLITVGAPDAVTVECPACHAPAGSPCLSAARKEPTPIKTIHEGRTSRASDLPPVYAPADNDTSRGLALLLAAERITDYTDPTYMTFDMVRGHEDEPRARDVYTEHFAPATEAGFMVRDDWGFKIGYSPDGLVGEDGLIEVKSRRQKKHLRTILDGEVPAENMAQLQCGLLVSGRDWIDYVSYCGGMPLWVKRVTPDPRWHKAIVLAVDAFEQTVEQMTATYQEAVAGLPMTERISNELGLEF